jgi:hypothetical protein
MFIYKEAAVRRMEDIVVNTTCCVLVVFPIFALSYLTGKVEKLIVILTFVLLVSVVSSVLANAVHKSSLAVIAT